MLAIADHEWPRRSRHVLPLILLLPVSQEPTLLHPETMHTKSVYALVAQTQLLAQICILKCATHVRFPDELELARRNGFRRLRCSEAGVYFALTLKLAPETTVSEIYRKRVA